MADVQVLLLGQDSSIWEQHSALFRHLYLENNFSLKKVKQVAEERYGFPMTSLSTYQSKLRDELGLRKNINSDGWIAIGQRIRHLRGQQWEVYFNGDLLSPQRVMRETRRYGKRQHGNILRLPPNIYVNIPAGPATVLNSSALSRRLEMSSPSRATAHQTSTQDMELYLVRNELLPVALEVSSPSEASNAATWLAYRTPRIFDATVEVANSAATAFGGNFCGALLDPRFTKSWRPQLDHVPVAQMQAMLRTFFFSSNNTTTSDTMRSDSQDADPDAGQLQILQSPRLSAVSSHSRLSANRSTHSSTDRDTGLSSHLNPFHLLSITFYYLSNNFSELPQIRQLMSWLTANVPRELVRTFLQSRSLSVRASWIRLTEWSFDLNEKALFQLTMEALMTEPEWIDAHGPQCLILAASLNQADICRKLLDHGTSPDQARVFQLENRRSRDDSARFVNLAVARNFIEHQEVETLAIIEAAAGGHTEVLKVLKHAGASVKLRCEGFTAGGHTLLAFERAALDAETCRDVFAVLLEMGEEVDAPVWEKANSPKEYAQDPYDKHNFVMSVESLLDKAYFTGDNSLFMLLCTYSSVPDSLLTVSGITRAAKTGPQAAQEYLNHCKYPLGYVRRQIEERAWVRSLRSPKVFFSLSEVGYQLRPSSRVLGLILNHQGNFKWGYAGTLPFLVHTLEYEEKAFESAWRYLFNAAPEARIKSILACKDDVPERLLREVLTEISQEEILDESFIGINWIDAIFRYAPPQDEFYTRAFVVKLSRRNELKALKTVLRYKNIVNDHISLETGMEIVTVLVAAACWNKTNSENGASIATLEFLFEHGARIGHNSVSFDHGMESKNVIFFHPITLRWLVLNGLLFKRASIYSILARHVPSSHHGNHQFASSMSALVDCLLHKGFPWSPEIGLSTICQQPCSAETLSLGDYIHLYPGNEYLERLLDKGIDMHEAKNARTALSALRETPLIAAVITRNADMVDTLISRGASVNVDIHGYTILQYCLTYSTQNLAEQDVTLRMVSSLLKGGADANCMGWKSSTPPLMQALHSKDPRLVETLVRYSANPNVCSQYTEYDHNFQLEMHQRTALEHVVRMETCHWPKHQREESQLRLVTLLLDHGACTDNKVLYSAYRSGNLKVVKLLLIRGAPPNATRWQEIDNSNQTPLEHALTDYCLGKEYRRQLVTLLLDHGAAHLNAWFGNFGDKSLCIACELGDTEIIRLLLDRGADPNMVEVRWANETHTVLAVSSQKGDVAAALLLLASGAKLSRPDNSLQVAAAAGRLDMVALLLNHETRQEEWAEALFKARKQGHLAIAQMIRDHIAANDPSREAYTDLGCSSEESGSSDEDER